MYFSIYRFQLVWPQFDWPPVSYLAYIGQACMCVCVADGWASDIKVFFYVGRGPSKFFFVFNIHKNNNNYHLNWMYCQLLRLRLPSLFHWVDIFVACCGAQYRGMLLLRHMIDAFEFYRSTNVYELVQTCIPCEPFNFAFIKSWVTPNNSQEWKYDFLFHSINPTRSPCACTASKEQRWICKCCCCCRGNGKRPNNEKSKK